MTLLLIIAAIALLAWFSPVIWAIGIFIGLFFEFISDALHGRLPPNGETPSVDSSQRRD